MLKFRWISNLKNYCRTYAIIEDDQSFQEKFISLLKVRPNFGKVESFYSSEEFLKFSFPEQFDLIFLDLDLPGIDGIQLLKSEKMQTLQMPKIILTGFHSDAKIFEGIKNGAVGYILKEDFQSLNSLINTIEDGRAVISPGVATWISDFFNKPKFNHPKLNLLTSREEQVIQCLSDGYTPHEISKLLDIKIGTTRVHIKSIYQKLHINSQLQLIRLLNEEKYK